MGKEYLINNKINPNNKEGLYPQNSGIKTKEELIKYLNEKYGENCNKII
ncbi:hypothetical protein [Psychrilyobacter atlanticus]|nr:hypothetical protein [Psychrilyobacter atlanticus]